MTERALFTVPDAAEYLSIDISTVYRLAAEGLLEKRYIGKVRFRIPRTSLDAYIAGLPTEAAEVAS